MSNYAISLQKLPESVVYHQGIVRLPSKMRVSAEL